MLKASGARASSPAPSRAFLVRLNAPCKTDSGGEQGRNANPGRNASGFTLIELMIVLALILILASFAVPTYHVAIARAREAVLREDLYTMRKLIDQYTIDKQQPPQTLQDLVDAGYLRGGVPTDPFTGRNDTWQTQTEDVPMGNQQSGPGLVDVHSGAAENSLDGTPYSSW